MLSSAASLLSEVCEAKIKLAELRFYRLLRKYSPNQPRVPAGNPDAGQWTGGGSETPDELVLASSGYSLGRLIAEIPLLTGGRNCIYKFDFATIAVPGPNYGRCQPWIPSSGAVHGRFLNDN